MAVSSQATSWRAEGPQGELALIKVFDRKALVGIDLPSLEHLSKVRHPNVAEIIDHGRDAEGRVYVATRFIEGTTLARELSGKRGLPNDLVRNLGIAIARALGAIHGQGLVHRDVKPSNIVIPASGDFEQAVLVDLDLVGERRSDTGHTQELVVVGSPAYFSPEQIMGQGLTQQADLWALGVVLFECALGQRPFETSSVADMFRAILARDVEVSGLPIELRRPIQWALTRALSARVPDARTLERELLRVPARVIGGAFTVRPQPAPAAAASARSLPDEAFAETAAAPASSLPAVARSHAVPSHPRAASRPAPHVAIALGAVLFAVTLAAVGRFVPVSAATLLAVAVAAAAGIVAGFLVQRLYASRRAPSTDAVRGTLERKQSVTASIALTVRQLGEQYRADPRARLLTESMALVLQHCDSIDELEPDERLKVTLQVLDAFMRLEARMPDTSQPWYQRHEKAVTWLGALGTACAAWWGLGESVMTAAGEPPPAGLIRGCPVGEVAMGTRIHLEAVDGAPLDWSLGGKPLLVATSFDWPDDAKVPSAAGTYPIFIRREGAAAAGAWCVIQVH
ncbi:MAG TPA: serine/threonine-protein kinase [Polyangiaceae bacterium]|nr:serine/threonine-protein kinase [Polyangiaceae bacterium]